MSIDTNNMKGTLIVILSAIALVNTVLAETSHPNTDPSQASTICAVHGSDSILIAHEDCDKFYKCFQGLPVPISCPNNLLYNPEKEYCDWPENVSCQKIVDKEGIVIEEAEDTPKGNGDPSEAPAICAAEGSDGILIAHEDCDKFYKCSEGIPATLRCPQNLLYNPEKEYCDWPENVSCQKIVDKEGVVIEEDEDTPKGNGDPSEAPAICAAEGSDGILIAHEDCDKFYKCSEGIPAPLSCPHNLLYNPLKEYCDWPENVKCGTEALDTDKEAESDKENENSNANASKACAVEGSDGKLIPHEDCNKFYMCSEGQAVALGCPANLLYNPDKQYCDWAENVACN